MLVPMCSASQRECTTKNYCACAKVALTVSLTTGSGWIMDVRTNHVITMTFELRAVLGWDQ